MEQIRDFWDFTIVPAFQTIYYIARYGLEGAVKKSDERLARLKEELRDELKRN